VTTGVRISLGIPYATAARFGSPKAIAFDATRADGTSFGPAAPQALDGPLGDIVPGMKVRETDEASCLTLNVWAPPPSNTSKAVLVWFHGGSFVIGASSQPVYDGEHLAAEQDVVVVSVNYRIGAFGFLDARSVGGVANCGLRDAICALEWVRDNIAHFGGDASRVVAFGESAGGGLLLHALAAPAARGLVAAAIIQSGATFATLDEKRADIVVEALITAAGVEEPGALRDLSADALVAAQSTAMGPLLGTVGMMPFHPMVDDEFLPAEPVEAFTAGAAAGVALIAGTTADEMRLFVDSSATPAPRDKLVRRAARYLGIDEAEAAGIVERYESAVGTDDTNELWRALFGDNEMQRPCRAVLDAHAPYGPTYTYCFTWAGPQVGACHGIDIPFPFGNFVDGWDTFVGLDDDGRALGRAMRDAWAAFARTDDPGWPAYPAARIFGRKVHDAAEHPLFGRLPTL
jgi:para-nitrobenzyl esterase